MVALEPLLFSLWPLIKMRKNSTQNRWVIPALAVFLIVGFPLAALCQKASIGDVRISGSHGAWRVGFSVKNCFTAKMEEAIRSGIATTFTFYIGFYQSRTWWKDRKMASVDFHHTLQYDPIRAEYRVMMGENGSVSVTPTLEAAKELMARVDGVQIASSPALNPGAPTHIRIKAELDPVRLPLHLESFLFFVSLWDFETDWHVESITP